VYIKYIIYEHRDNKDINGKMVYGSAPYGCFFIDGGAEHAFSDMLRYCDYFKRRAKESPNYEIVEDLCDGIKEHIEGLYKVIELDYMQRINNYISKEQMSDNS
jgi:hypothetical protein